MIFDRRGLLQAGGAAALVGCSPQKKAAAPSSQVAADHVIEIVDAKVEVAPGMVVQTTTYNGQFPGPLLRMKEGVPVTIDIRNKTAKPEQLHWHGQKLPVDVDGSAEEGTPYIPAHGSVSRLGLPASASTTPTSSPART